MIKISNINAAREFRRREDKLNNNNLDFHNINI